MSEPDLIRANKSACDQYVTELCKQPTGEGLKYAVTKYCGFRTWFLQPCAADHAFEKIISSSGVLL